MNYKRYVKHYRSRDFVISKNNFGLFSNCFLANNFNFFKFRENGSNKYINKYVLNKFIFWNSLFKYTSASKYKYILKRYLKKKAQHREIIFKRIKKYIYLKKNNN